MIADDMYTENYAGENSYNRDYYKDDVVCCAPHCKNRRRTTRGLHYFGLSGKHKELFCQRTGRRCPKRCIYVCEEHISLEEDCYRTGGGLLRLKKTASFPLVQNASENISIGQKPSFKYCIVPDCGNTIVKSPEKLFFLMPRGEVIRRKWCEAIKRDMVSPKSALYCCEDHFNLEEDTENYMEYKIITLQKKKKHRLRLKKDAIPHKFLHLDDLKRKHLDTDTNEDMSSSPAKQRVVTRASESKVGITKTHTHGPEEYNRDESYQESDPLIKEETIEEIEDITTSKVKVEFEDFSEVTWKPTSDDNDETIDPDKCPESEPNKDTSDMTIEQFMRGCDLYLSPELAYYVKTQLKRPV